MQIIKAQYCKDSDGNKLSVVKATIDGEEMFVPIDVTDNLHWTAILKWVAEGNTIAEAD
tara:strand:- start:47 stop:223 length:177 start_codon:yes stop_codon:yes gene_type:complete